MFKKILQNRKKLLIGLPMAAVAFLLLPVLSLLLLWFLAVKVPSLSWFEPILYIRTPAQDQALYEQAIASCENQIWVIIEDIGPTYSSIKEPFPAKWDDAHGGILYDFACTNQEIQEKEESLRSERAFWGPILLLATVTSWLIAAACLITWLFMVGKSVYQKFSNKS